MQKTQEILITVITPIAAACFGVSSGIFMMTVKLYIPNIACVIIGILAIIYAIEGNESSKKEHELIGRLAAATYALGFWGYTLSYILMY